MVSYVPILHQVATQYGVIAISFETIHVGLQS